VSDHARRHSRQPFAYPGTAGGTLYGGQPVHLEGPALNVDADGSAARNAEMYLFFGVAVLVIGGMFGGLALAADIRNRR
jgi:hypothetical protein